MALFKKEKECHKVSIYQNVDAIILRTDNKKVKIIVFTHISNVTGTVLPVKLSIC